MKTKKHQPDAGKLLLAILSQIPPESLKNFALLAAQRVDDNDLATDLLRFAADPDAEASLAETVAMYLTYTELRATSHRATSLRAQPSFAI
jgi:hypothetical protein